MVKSFYLEFKTVFKMKAFRNIIAICIALLIWTACQEDVNKPMDQAAIPQQVIEPRVENLPGAARITYTLPDDPNLYYVRAEYSIGNGVRREAKATFYSNSLTVDGFSSTDQQEVRLYSVNKSEQSSEPVVVKIKPLTPAIQTVFASLTLDSDFGGVTAGFQNPDKANIAVGILVANAAGEWEAVDTHYTSQESGVFSVRGFEATKRRFGVYVRDRWLNASDTLEAELTPVFEKELDKSKFRAMDLPTDYNRPNSSTTVMARIWDGNTASNRDFLTKPSTTPGVGGIPQWFTFDLGATAKLSRLVVHTRDNEARFIYNSGTIKTWEIWGSNNPNPDGSWDSWTRLLVCESVKPSGMPVGAYSQEDLDYVRAGWEFTFPPGTPAVKYIRWKTLANWGGVTHINLTEATFYGSDQ